MNRTIRQLGTSGPVAGIVVAGILLAACAPPPSPAPRTVYVEPPAPRTTTVEDARSILREEPSGKAALKEAERFQAAGNREAFFLLVKYAASRKRVPEAAYEMGRMYDPETHAKGVVLEPNVLVAAQWFRWGARNGHVPSMFRLGLMYKDGILEATGAASEIKNGVLEELLGMDATDRSFYWLDKAARAGESTQ